MAKKTRARGKASAPSPSLQKRLARQRASDQVNRNKTRAQSAVRKFRPRKSEHGRFVLITAEGKRADTKKSRKGFLVYVAKQPNRKTGKRGKSLAYHSKDFTATKLTTIEAPLWRNAKAAQEFERAKLVVTGKGRNVVKGRGAVDIAGSVNDFSDKTVEKIARSIKRTIENQASHRIFQIEVTALVETPNGLETFNFTVPIAKADHIAIELAGLLNFVRQKFYAFMARTLALAGYVTAGSANHIRRLSVNQGKPVDQWKDGKGQKWESNENQVVKLRQLEWVIKQAQ